MIAPTHAMVLAAGLGTRMRPLTDDRPKPLLPLEGRSLLHHAMDRLRDAGISNLVVNAHWFAEQIADAVEAYGGAPPPVVLRETALLETGGGVKAALPHLGSAPFVVVNGDAFWLDGPNAALRRMAAAFDPEEMDALLLLVRTAHVDGETGRGDFLLDPLGRARRPKEREIAPYLFGGVQILSPALFADTPDGAFSLNRVYDRAIENGRLFGLVHDGAWFHLSTPRDLDRAETMLRAGILPALF
ncbi:mannose-1-phosphate guanylyltransferase [Falsiroseomonas bella]|uniref:Mannose-1-phosphate guanylyltransferase n=1 Tax=Falsiroseomonas bella TaxID=2184016 RepID=A0A317FLP9_9PROT|nr:nucleotidyltransferase family protein [Falsiroseomonas bella]PWS38889.1 mannose-1-phosphate guanylyltransferase [Falsiroseomonas bella]